MNFNKKKHPLTSEQDFSTQNANFGKILPVVRIILLIMMQYCFDSKIILVGSVLQIFRKLTSVLSVMAMNYNLH